ncbi:MAG: ankyrin repeat domain-containing protein [Campylobacterota bacterium]|nr:ankyrin repeat domain-containing protein [Campylobacterota bacterium]
MLKNFFQKNKDTQDELQLAFLSELLKKEYDEELLLRLLYDSGIDINLLDENGDSYLHICLKKHKFKSAFWLIRHNIDVALKNKDKLTTLDIALEENNHNIVKELLKTEELDLNEKDEFGRTKLQNTVVFGYETIAKMLIDFGADINSKDIHNRNVIFDALSYGNEKFISYLLELNNLELNNIDTDGNTIMHHPQVRANEDIALNLILHGADATIKNKEGKTFLCESALKGMDGYKLVDAALKEGADINSRVAYNNTILMELVTSLSTFSVDEIDRRESLMQITQKLLLKGIDVDAVNINGETALFRAVRTEDKELIRFLLSAGIDPNIQNKDYQSALFIAIYQGIRSLDTITLMLKYKADLLLKNNKGQTIFEILNDIILHTHGKKRLNDQYLLSKIDQEGQYMVVLQELLRINEKDLNILDSNGDPLFFKPLLSDHFTLFNLYIKSGLDIHLVNSVNHNVFFEYVLQVFAKDDTKVDFQNIISMLISKKLDQNFQDEDGDTVVHKVIGTDCNFHLFDILTQVVLFDYHKTNKMGRSVIHNAVWSGKKDVLKRIHQIDASSVNIPDAYGILPITYAALLGAQDFVLLFIDLKANVNSGLKIPQKVIDRFLPMVKNLDKLKDGIEDEDILRKIDILTDQVKRDFNLIK